MRQLASSLDRLGPAVPVVLRVVLGGLFVWHGLDKFDAGIDMVEGAFAGWGVPAASIAAPAVSVLEVVGGIALIAGVATRLVALALAAVMVGAIAYVKADLGVISTAPMPGAELDLALLAGLVVLAVQGPGSLSVDGALRFEQQSTGSATAS